MSYEFETLLCEQLENIMVITVNRPEVLNALNDKVFHDLHAVFTQMRSDTSIKAVVITGAGKAFVAGADILHMSTHDSIQARRLSQEANRSQQAIATFPRPVIAAVNGHCYGGGCEIAMCCDMIVASEKAKFGQLEINLAIIPGGGGTQRLQRLVGPQQCKRLVYSGEPISAQEALTIGLVTFVVPHEQVLEEALTWAKKIVRKSGFALEVAKTAIDVGGELDLNSALQLEIELFAQCFATVDQKEGMRAFLEKREAKFVL